MYDVNRWFHLLIGLHYPNVSVHRCHHFSMLHNFGYYSCCLQNPLRVFGWLSYRTLLSRSAVCFLYLRDFFCLEWLYRCWAFGLPLLVSPILGILLPIDLSLFCSKYSRYGEMYLSFLLFIENGISMLFGTNDDGGWTLLLRFPLLSTECLIFDRLFWCRFEVVLEDSLLSESFIGVRILEYLCASFPSVDMWFVLSFLLFTLLLSVSSLIGELKTTIFAWSDLSVFQTSSFEGELAALWSSCSVFCSTNSSSIAYFYIVLIYL